MSKLQPCDFYELCQVAIQAARRAGEVVRGYGSKAKRLGSKNGGSSKASEVLTEADLASQRSILSDLRSTVEKYDLAILAEEGIDDRGRLVKEYFWCIDPLDGTLPFTEGRDGYSISIALVDREGRAKLGVVYDPLNRRLYHGIVGVGAFLNEERWELENQPGRDDGFTLVTDRSFLNHNRYAEVLNTIERFAELRGYGNVRVISHGGAVMNGCWALEQSPACYFKLPKTAVGGGSIWDYAAISAICNALGGFASRCSGEDLPLNNPDSTFMNRYGVLFTTQRECYDMLVAISIPSVSAPQAGLRPGKRDAGV